MRRPAIGVLRHTDHAGIMILIDVADAMGVGATAKKGDRRRTLRRTEEK
jgi:hypothetical protein